MIRAALLVLATLAAQAAAEDAPDRVLVADRDPELVRAIERSLAPWHLTVVAAPAPEDPARVSTSADAAGAWFVVWREDDQLVVYDRARGTTERRPARAGAFDPVTAAAAALTIKTMMRLPADPTAGIADPSPSEVEPTAVTATTTAAPSAPSGPELRVQTGVGARLARGSQSDVGARASLAVFLRPSRRIGLRFGVAGELGTSPAIAKGQFEGTWSDASVLALASWTVEARAVAIEPLLGAGVLRFALDGADRTSTRAERATLPLVRAGLIARWLLGAWSLGAYAAIDAPLRTRAYTQPNQGMGMGSNELFEVPAFMAVLGVVGAVDLGR